MKIKYRFLYFIAPHYIILWSLIKFALTLNNTNFWVFKWIVNVLLAIEVISVIYFHFGTPIRISNHIITKRFYFFSKSVEINENTLTYIKPLFGFLKKRLIIISNNTRMTLWSIYTIPLSDILNEISLPPTSV